MAQAVTGIVNKPAWVDLSSSDAEASRTAVAMSRIRGRLVIAAVCGQIA